jgi:galactose mutarotase-like enzyme
MDVELKNNDLTIKIHSKGAELFSVFNKSTGLEYMWSGDPSFWGKTSPVLFPIVGTLKEDKFVVDGKSYTLSRHGFARDLEFEVNRLSNDKAQFTLNSDDASLKKYPFRFSFTMTYSLVADVVQLQYSVENKNEGDMFFSLGAHPAFKVPLIGGTLYDDHYLEFNQKETAGRWPISAQGLIEQHPAAFLENSQRIDLRKELFYEDAIVLKHLRSNVVSLKATTHPHGLEFHFDGFPFMGLWAARNADFVCIEPWCGIADSVNHNLELNKKEGIERITNNTTWTRTWKARFF